MRVEILFTLDYEVFGDGSGDPMLFQISNTKRLAETLSVFGGVMTVFVEYGAIRFFQEHSDQVARFSSWFREICSQLVSLASAGHDIQLHLHPTWEGAQCASNGQPLLKLDQDDLTKLHYHRAREWLLDGKRFLEELLCPINPAYECKVFRAGAFTVGNAQAYSDLLSETGFLVDSSVVPGAVMRSSYGNFDYRSIRTSSPYRFRSNFTIPESQGMLVEYPILTEISPTATLKYRNLHGGRNRNLMNRYYPEKLTDAGRNRWAALLKKVLRGYALADFNFLGAAELAAIIQTKIANGSAMQPMVLIGHSKFSFFSDELLVLDHVLKDKGICPVYTTVTDHHRRLFS